MYLRMYVSMCVYIYVTVPVQLCMLTCVLSVHDPGLLKGSGRKDHGGGSPDT